ncbi:Wall-associated receptor kinase-like 10 [Citrus sinensis]|uniref:wall-associated receptor kinase-like 10 n=1 Tax=Citrus clementina TaxID=85681 RepID=UPI000CED38D1|nr:wall-associated receptor kinase-like 10 [Citrus x clementina]XP_052287188.1 wall-associated receptor kinase-like 10 [Citrus sinensis]KAH9666306.1 Wall-associated receptor kinase-like 10 [Citrus sinensis]
MAVHNGLVLLQIILLPWTVESASEPLSCPDRCGNVLIEYPFGIGAGCYFDESFEVVCDNSSGSPKAILQKIGQEISSYTSYSGSPNIAVNISVTSLSSINNAKGINLTGTPFSFSQRINKFLAIGCDNYANNQQNDSISSNSILTDAGGECISICTSNPSENSDCCDMVCNIPQNSSTKVLDANTSYVYSQSIPQGCTSLSLVDPDWIFSNYLKTPSGLKDKKKIPAVLEWGKYKGVCYEDYNSHTKVCNKDDRCLIQLSSGHFCRCDYSRNSVYQDYFCEGDLICNTTSGHNCSKCPDGYNYYRPAYYRPLQERRCSPKRSRDSFFSKKTRVKYVVIGCTSGGLGMFLLIGAWWLFKFVKRRREIKLKQKFFKRNGGLLLQQELASTEGTIEKTKLFTSKELERATDNFNLNRILGQGGQGTVYKGMLPDGKIVAVKKSKVIDERKVEEFINEMVILSQINHRNVVKLLGCCLETEVPLLVYEFIPNGTLFQYIHDQNEDFPITWEMRLRIAIEVSGALSYLHSAASIPIYHRDIKSTNILLDDKYRAKVSDFGASRSMAVDQTHMTTQVHGTFGYLDPEYFRSSQFTDKSDVYSFGVVLVELLTGEKPIRFTTLEEDKSLAAYFLCAMKEERLFEILDARVMKEGGGDEIIIFAKVAKRCLNLNGKKRPTMREVASELAGIKAWNGASNVIEEDLEEIDCALGDIYIVANSETDGSINGSFLDDVTISMDANPLIKSNW